MDSKGRHYDPAELVRVFGQMLKAAYPDVCDEALFVVYDRCEEHIRQQL